MRSINRKVQYTFHCNKSLFENQKGDKKRKVNMVLN